MVYEMEESRGESASRKNLLRIYACCDRLAEYVRTGSKNDVVLFSNLCLSLAREISNAIANKVIPERAHELPLLLIKVYQFKNDAYSHAAILLLMISIKNACENKWFLDQESEVLLTLANEILGSFCSTMNFNTEPSSYISTISIIMSRYYPKLKMGEILAFLEVKPGYETRIHDFLISTDTKIIPEERARLIVVQLDNTETSSCLISPVQANFLLNGIGVYGRNNVHMNTRPQMPTQIFDLLKYGVNLLQVVGEFKGNYMVVVAFMSMGPTPDHLELQDYVQSPVNLDSELIEGPSRISLNCPISLKRIKVAVKGHMCKHSQCFDYESYLEINSIKPSWCCPLCNQHVCFTDIRIDQNMAKVIEEVGHTVNDVIIYSNGSWKAIMEDIMEDESGPGPVELSGFSSGPADIKIEVGPTRGVLTLTPPPLQGSTMNSQNIGLEAQSQTFGQRSPLPIRANVGPLPGLTRQCSPLSHTNQGCSQTVITQQAQVIGVGPTQAQVIGVGPTPAQVIGVGPKEWRPSRSMRGSLSGKAYVDYYNQHIVQPAHKGRSVPNVTGQPLESSSQMKIQMANETALAQIGNISYRRLKSANTVGGSSVLRQGSSMNK